MASELLRSPATAIQSARPADPPGESDVAAAALASALSSLAVPHVLLGRAACRAYGSPLATDDVHAVVDADAREIALLRGKVARLDGGPGRFFAFGHALYFGPGRKTSIYFFSPGTIFSDGFFDDDAAVEVLSPADSYVSVLRPAPLFFASLGRAIDNMGPPLRPSRRFNADLDDMEFMAGLISQWEARTTVAVYPFDQRYTLRTNIRRLTGQLHHKSDTICNGCMDLL